MDIIKKRLISDTEIEQFILYILFKFQACEILPTKEEKKQFCFRCEHKKKQFLPPPWIPASCPTQNHPTHHLSPTEPPPRGSLHLRRYSFSGDSSRSELRSDSHFNFAVANPPSPPLESEVVTAVVYDDEEEKKITDAVAMVEDEDGIEEEVKSVVMTESSDLVKSGGDEEVMLPPISNWNNLPPRMNLPPTEKPLVSSRFGHRRLVKASPEERRNQVKKKEEIADFFPPAPSATA